jgi:hypothetical protein
MGKKQAGERLLVEHMTEMDGWVGQGLGNESLGK